MKKESLGQPITSREFFQWPETQALLKRLGVKVQRTEGLTIALGPGINDMVRVYHQFQGIDALQFETELTTGPDPATADEAVTTSCQHERRGESFGASSDNEEG